jgi:hypothetical protein
LAERCCAESLSFHPALTRESVDRDLAENASRLANRCERRIEITRQRNIVKSSDDEIFGHLQTSGAERVDDPDRRLIIGARDGLGEWFSATQALLHRGLSARRRPVTLEEVGLVERGA